MGKQTHDSGQQQHKHADLKATGEWRKRDMATVHFPFSFSVLGETRLEGRRRLAPDHRFCKALDSLHSDNRYAGHLTVGARQFHEGGLKLA